MLDFCFVYDKNLNCVANIQFVHDVSQESMLAPNKLNSVDRIIFTNVNRNFQLISVQKLISISNNRKRKEKKLNILIHVKKN